MAYFILLAIVIIQSILSLGHWFIYRTAVRFLGITDPEKILALRWAAGILSVTFVLATVIAFRYYNLITRIFYTIAASWLGIFYFLLLACVLIWLGSILPVNRRLLAEALLFLAFVAGINALVNANTVRLTEVTVKLPNLPSAWQDKTAVWISDLHLGQLRNRGFAEKITNQISALHPDAIFIGGDLFDGVAVDQNKVTEPFAGLKAPQGVYFITGNHEEFGDDTKYINAVKNAGITILDNRLVDLGGLQLIGVDYKDSSGSITYKDILDNLKLDRNKPSILLKHEPNNLDVAEQAGIKFQISGHTHRAQVWPLSYVPRAVYKGFDYGLKKYKDMAVYTSSGAGTWGPPIRFLTYPEIVKIKFE